MDIRNRQHSVYVTSHVVVDFEWRRGFRGCCWITGVRRRLVPSYSVGASKRSCRGCATFLLFHLAVGPLTPESGERCFEEQLLTTSLSFSSLIRTYCHASSMIRDPEPRPSTFPVTYGPEQQVCCQYVIYTQLSWVITSFCAELSRYCVWLLGWV